MEELITNLHIHTKYSDGTGTHQQIANVAMRCGLDVLMVTDHNLYAGGFDRFYNRGKKKLMLIVGEEIHNRQLLPPRNHLLAFGYSKEISQIAENHQQVVNIIQGNGGFTAIAHPFEVPMGWFHEPEFSWTSWDVEGIKGYELWNNFSELKDRAHSLAQGVIFAFFPFLYPERPPQRSITKWDELNLQGKRMVAIGGSDAHSLHMGNKFLHINIFPYRFHFKSVNTHILTPRGLSDNYEADRSMILEALNSGHVFIGYDRPAPTKGFLFTAQGKKDSAIMGDEILLKPSITFQIRLPERVDCRLIKDGKVIQSWHRQNYCTYITSQPGIYRVEADIIYFGKKRAWIYSNPIYARLPDSSM